MNRWDKRSENQPSLIPGRIVLVRTESGEMDELLEASSSAGLPADKGASTWEAVRAPIRHGGGILF